MNKFKLAKLKNGLPVVLVPIAGAPTISAFIIFKTGSRYEAKAISGLSHFVEHMFFKGTKKRPTTLELSSELDSLGGEYNAFTGKENTAYFVKIAKANFPKALEVLSDMLLNSKFSAEEIEREKGVIIEEINMYEDNPLMSLEDVFENLLYGETPLGRDTAGTKEIVSKFTQADFLNYVKNQYGVKSALVCLAGNFQTSGALKLLNKYLSPMLKNNWQDKVKITETQIAPALKIKTKKTDQAHLCLGVRAFPLGHPQEFIAKLLAIILGGGMSSRLFIELRERRGLAYYVHTGTNFYGDCGYLSTSAGVPPLKIKEAIEVIVAEMKKMTTTLVPAAELKRAKDMLSGRAVLQLEGSDKLAIWYASEAINRKKIITPGEYLKKIKAVTAKDLQKLAKQLFIDKNLNLALIADLNNSAELKKILHF